MDIVNVYKRKQTLNECYYNALIKLWLFYDLNISAKKKTICTDEFKPIRLNEIVFLFLLTVKNTTVQKIGYFSKDNFYSNSVPENKRISARYFS